MRDIAITLLIFSAIPVMVRRPWIGVLIFAWISLMTPHRFAYGFAYSFPFAMVVAVATLVGLLVTKDEVRYDFHPVLLFMFLLPAWTCVTTLFAFSTSPALGRLEEVLKIFLFVHVSAMVLRTRVHIDLMIWVLVLSVGFFGVKGGLYTIVTQGGGKVWGPPGDSFLTDNNAIAVALVMIVPLVYYLRSMASSAWLRLALLLVMVLCGVAVLGTYSRGGFLAACAMLLFLWLKSTHKVRFAFVAALIVPVIIVNMPEKWMNRMDTISTYEEDSSAMGRVNAWHTAFNIANDRPLVGGGFELYNRDVFAQYAPNPEAIHAAHSVYFQILGEHGYVGLALLLGILVSAWLTARKTISISVGRDDLIWANRLTRAIQVSLVGYLVGGTFVNIGYWDLVYYEIVLLVIAHRLVSAAPVGVTPGLNRRTTCSV